MQPRRLEWLLASPGISLCLQIRHLFWKVSSLNPMDEIHHRSLSLLVHRPWRLLSPFPHHLTSQDLKEPPYQAHLSHNLIKGVRLGGNREHHIMSFVDCRWDIVITSTATSTSGISVNSSLDGFSGQNFSSSHNNAGPFK